MHARKPGWLVVAGILPGVALLLSNALAAAPAEAVGPAGSVRASAAPGIDAEVAPLTADGSGGGVLRSEDGMLVPVQSGGWGGSNSGWHGGWPVVCTSDNNRRRTCNKPSNQTVRVERQLSQTRCTEGVNWGQNRSQIWVNNGCAARFAPSGNWNNGGWGSGGNHWGGPEVVCESRNFRYNQCNWRSNWGFPQLVQQLSQARCVRDRTWGYNRSRGFIWVDEGCGARFRGR